MDQKPTSTNEDSWGTWLLQEIKVIAAQAVGVVAALWVRHLVMRAIDGKVLDKNIVQNGLQAGPPRPPATTTLPVMSPSQQQSSFSQFRTPRPWKEGPGRIWIPEIQRYVSYRTKYNLPDGTEVYDHDETLNRGHSEGPCPLLKARVDCWDCQHSVARPNFQRDTHCAARLWLDEIQNPEVSLRDVAASM